MKVTGKQTVIKSIDIELSEEEISRIVKTQPIEFLADAIQNKVMKNFIDALKPQFDGKRAIRESHYQSRVGKLVLVHVDESWNYHNNVSEDKEVRPLTQDEISKYTLISGLSDRIKNMNK